MRGFSCCEVQKCKDALYLACVLERAIGDIKYTIVGVDPLPSVGLKSILSMSTHSDHGISYSTVRTLNTVYEVPH